MSAEICVDANVVIKWYVPESLRNEAITLADECFNEDIDLIAPDFIFAEITSAIRRAVHRKLMPTTDGLLTVGLMMHAPIIRFDVRDLYEEAWRLADLYKLPTLYDAYYLALAELRGCEFWTADERLINSVPGLSYVKHLMDYVPGSLKADT